MDKKMATKTQFSYRTTSDFSPQSLIALLLLNGTFSIKQKMPA